MKMTLWYEMLIEAEICSQTGVGQEMLKQVQLIGDKG